MNSILQNMRVSSVIVFRLISTKFFLVSYLGMMQLLSRQGVVQVQSFNIDEEYPIVIIDSFDGQTAHFGLTVSLLERSTVSPEGEDQPTGWVLIGAPKANSTYPDHATIIEPGVVWRCAIRRKEILNEDCKVIVMDPTDAYDPFDQKQSHTDRKDGGWLGGSMFAGESDRFVACASRWVNRKFKDLHAQQGICYWVPRSHVSSDAVNSSWPWLPSEYSYRLIPLVTNSIGTNLQSIPDPPHNDTQRFYWTYGQAGFSVYIPKNNEMILGAPGVYEWTGSVIQYRDARAPNSKFKRQNAYSKSPVFSEFLVAKLQNLSTGESDILGHFDYFGYSVTSGNYFHKNVSASRTQYAAGAPRAASMSGKVFVFSFRETKEKRTAKLDILADPIEGKDANASQKHYGSYFGSVLLSLDVTNDGFDDLLVGAPLYGTEFSKTRSIFDPIDNETNSQNEGDSSESSRTSMTSGDEGCVFLYISTGYDFVQPPHAICGDKEIGSRFGSSITNLGDLNLDGFNDIAVGAPYENDGRGAVYIYHGGNKLTLAQKLTPGSIDSTIKGFGYSLSLGLDIDDNRYPDLAVGAYESNKVVVYRTTPLANLTGNLSVSISKLLTRTEEFNVTSCVAFNGFSLPKLLHIWVKMSFGTESNEEKLVAWLSDENVHKPMAFTVKRLREYTKSGACFNFTAKRIGIIDGSVKSIVIRQDYWLNGSTNAPGPTKPIFYEIAKDPFGNPSVQMTNNSKSELGDFGRKDPLSITNMYSTNTYTLPIGAPCEADGDPSCLANMTLNACFRTTKDQIFDENTVFIIGSSKYLVLDVDIWNHRETANSPITVDIAWKSPPIIRNGSKLFPIGSDCHRIGTNSNSSYQNLYRCVLKKSIQEFHKETVKLEFDMTGIFGADTEEYFELRISANTSSLLVNEVQRSFKFRMKSEMELDLFDNTNGGTFAYDIQNRTVNFSHTYEVNIKGPTPAYKIIMEYYLPKYAIIDGTLTELFLIRSLTWNDVECEGLNATFQHNNKLRNPDEIPSPISIASIGNNSLVLKRTRRTLDAIFRKPDITDEDKDDIFTIDCEDNRIECMKVVCIAHKMNQTVSRIVEFKLRMITEKAKTFIPDFGIDFVVVSSHGRVKMLDKHGSLIGRETKFRFQTKLEVHYLPEIPAWILIVAVASGLIILTLMTLFLSRCGFFRRRKREELAALKVKSKKKNLDPLLGTALKKRYEDISLNSRSSVRFSTGPLSSKPGDTKSNADYDEW